MSLGLIFAGSGLPSEGVEWKNEAWLKQIAASGETCGLRLNRAINQHTDIEKGSKRETEGERRKEGMELNQKGVYNSIHYHCLAPHTYKIKSSYDLYIII